ncbi:MAG TPA: NAD(P)-dependent oxidoreductase [Candidatus Acidoferrales bacterium]|nr:NAD(P)-dependent oxidoreductase [Candidatus Acidoferrales bacterium]
MSILVTGSAGHLGEALMRTLRATGRDALGIDILSSPFTDHVGSIADRGFVEKSMCGVRTVLHAATLHKPHVTTHVNQEFVDTNITGTLNLLEAAAAVKVESFIFTSTTSAFGSALTPAPGEPAAWITEDVVPIPKNIYGVTKVAAENICELFARKRRLPILILRTSRFFPEADDDPATASNYETANAQANELLYRRVDIEDVVSAHLLAVEKAPQIKFGCYIISATTPFTLGDLSALRRDAPAVVARHFPDFPRLYSQKNWKMFPQLDRVYVNQLAREKLGWQPKYDFRHVLQSLRTDPH